MFHTAKQEDRRTWNTSSLLPSTKAAAGPAGKLISFKDQVSPAGLLCSREQAAALEQEAAFLLLLGVG